MARFVFKVVPVIFILLLFPTSGQPLDVDFLGRLESNFVLRDTDGFQYGLLDNNEGIQWRNELKFDLELRPEYKGGPPALRMDKIYLVYRGAYDAIFELRDDTYDNIREKKTDDYDLGKDDVEWENDLREAFVDLVAENPKHKAVLRLGRQIVQWGEADGFNLINIVCPDDFRYQMFFSAVEDTATPLWMARLNYAYDGLVGPFRNVNFELLAVPDIRPDVYAPLAGKDGFANFDAPYAFAFAAFEDPLGGALLPFFDTRVRALKQDVAGRSLDNMEYGARLELGIGNFLLDLHYFVGYQDEEAYDWSSYWTYWLPVLGGFGPPGAIGGAPEIIFRHPRNRTYGLSFNYFFFPLDFVFRGEASLTDKMALWEGDPTFAETTWITQRDVYQSLIGIDKDFKNLEKWIGTYSNLSTSFQFYWMHIDDWKDDVNIHPVNLEDSYRITFMTYTDYWHGRINPSIFAMYDPEGTWMTQAGIKYDHGGVWFFTLTEQSFWGNKNAISRFAGLIGTSELSFKVTYRF